MYIVPNMFVNVQLIGHTHTMGETYLSRSKYFPHVEDKMLAEIRCLVYHKQLTFFFHLLPKIISNIKSTVALSFVNF